VLMSPEPLIGSVNILVQVGLVMELSSGETRKGPHCMFPLRLIVTSHLLRKHRQ
jgi:hypothetical protein